jgi:hypothetical protein
VALTSGQAELKRRLIACHRSQHGVLQHVPIDTERFRVAPRYDFKSPPHAGKLLYEHFPWGVTGTEWRNLARQAAASLRANAGTRAERAPAMR